MGRARASTRCAGQAVHDLKNPVELPFCKLAVERMGGQIALRSTPGETTVFSVTLPMHAAETR